LPFLFSLCFFFFLAFKFCISFSFLFDFLKIGFQLFLSLLPLLLFDLLIFDACRLCLGFDAV